MIARWTAALRMASRDVWKNKRRSLLVIALVGLPIFALAVMDIGFRTWQLSPGEQATRQIGAAQAGLQWQGGPLVQTPSGWLGNWTSLSGTQSAQPSNTQVNALVPGSRVIERIDISAPLRFHTRQGIDQASLIGLDYHDPIATGLVHQLQGSPPAHSGEVAISSAVAAADNLRVGDRIRLVSQSSTVRVVGIVRDAAHRDDHNIYALPATAEALSGGVGPSGGADQTTWLVKSSTPITWARVRELNAAGFLVLSRQVMLHPPNSSQIDPRAAAGTQHMDTRPLAIAAVVAGMALLEVVLLAGPAFAVSARRRRRELGVVAATGGQPRDLRNVVLSGGVVLGFAAGIGAVLLALVVTAIGIPLFATRVNTLPGHYDVRPVELAVLTAVGVLTATIAALAPAAQAARTDVVAALTGMRGITRTRALVPVLGLSSAVLGVAVAVFGALSSRSALVILVGLVGIELGLVCCTPAMLGATARLGVRLPLPMRLAVRDAGRNRSSATPAVAAVMASVIGAVALSAGIASATAQDRANYVPTIPLNTVFTVVPGTHSAGPSSAQLAAVERVMHRTLPVSSSTVVNGVGGIVVFANAAQSANNTSDNVISAPLAREIVDDGTNLSTLFGRPMPAATAALRAGRAVVTDPSLLRSNTISFTFTSLPTNSGTSSNGGVQASNTPPARHIVLPATAVTVSDPAMPLVLIPPRLAIAQHLPYGPWGVLARVTRIPTDREQQTARGSLNSLSSADQLLVERGYQDTDSWLPLAALIVAFVIAVGAATIATALTAVDGRQDLITLGAIGADPKTRRLLASSRAGTIAGIGSIVGVLAGIIAPVAWVLAVRHQHTATQPRLVGDGRLLPPTAVLHLVLPWGTLAALLIGVPLLAALMVGIATNSRLPSERTS